MTAINSILSSDYRGMTGHLMNIWSYKRPLPPKKLHITPFQRYDGTSGLEVICPYDPAQGHYSTPCLPILPHWNPAALGPDPTHPPCISLFRSPVEGGQAMYSRTHSSDPNLTAILSYPLSNYNYKWVGTLCIYYWI